jgi:hypothetical protein
MDLLQLATWNDFGEGTIIEPTFETGFSYLMILQEFTGVSYGPAELMMIYKLFMLKKKYKTDEVKTAQLNNAATHLINLAVPQAKEILDTFEVITALDDTPSGEFSFDLYPNPLSSDSLNIRINGKKTQSPVLVTLSDISGSIPIEKFTKGIYHLNIQITGEVVATRLIVLE